MNPEDERLQETLCDSGAFLEKFVPRRQYCLRNRQRIAQVGDHGKPEACQPNGVVGSKWCGCDNAFFQRACAQIAAADGAEHRSLSGSIPLRRRNVRMAKSENAPAPVTPTVFPFISSSVRVDLLPTIW